MNEFTALMILLLTPGILGILILDSLIEHRQWSAFLYTVYAIVFGTAVYVAEHIGLRLYWLLASPPGDMHLLSIWSIISGRSTEVNPAEIYIGLIVAVLLAAGVSRAVNYKYANRLARVFKLSSKFGDENLFSYFLNTNESVWVHVRDIEDDVTYRGKVASYSEDAGIQEIVLREATVYQHTSSGLYQPYQVSTVYIAGTQGRFVIESVPREDLEEAEDG